ncbi:hypothetical protein HY634_02515 [Candidatus Uhrbacteria bacterium]|nr:hypothetical protein [Candidatus Uhrbacteria bacterium]
MDTRAKPGDSHDPREYRPVPDGGSKILTLLTVITAITGGLSWYLYRSTDGTSTSTDVDAALSGTLFVVWLIALVFFVSTAGIQILSAHWLRTVRGYDVACWIFRPTVFPERGPELRFEVLYPNRIRRDYNVAQPTLILPLGGWFRRPTILEPKDHRPTAWPLKRGQVRMVGSFELLHQDGVERAIAGNVVQLTDATGDRHTTTVWGALELLEKHGVQMLSDPHDGTLRRVFSGALLKVQRLTENLTAIHRVVENCNENIDKERGRMKAFLEDSISAIEHSGRLKGTLEGLRILKRLLDEMAAMCYYVEMDAKASNAYHARSADVTDKIVEKQKRDRRRHGKPTATTGT